MQVNLRRRAIILGAIVIVLILIVAYLYWQVMVISDPPAAFDSGYDKTATWIADYNATVEVFIQQTQAAMTQTPVP